MCLLRFCVCLWRSCVFVEVLCLFVEVLCLFVEVLCVCRGVAFVVVVCPPQRDLGLFLLSLSPYLSCI